MNVAMWWAAALSAAAPQPLPDLPAPLGMLDRVLEQGPPSDRTVEMQWPGCDKKTPLNLSRFVGGSAYAMQQMVEWLNLTPGLNVFAPGTLDEVSAGVTLGNFVEQRACKALPKEPGSVPKLCPGAAADHAWMSAKGKASVLVRWSASPAGKDRCLPKVVGTFFDAKGVARIRYEADFGGQAAGALLGDKCQVTFTFDAKNEVFHAGRRGCKGS